MGVMDGDVSDDVVCPVCGIGEHVIALEAGVWMCTVCVCEFNENEDGGFDVWVGFRIVQDKCFRMGLQIDES